jgi:hypothetical protein
MLNSGRSVELTSLEIFSTYGGPLEGYPCARINDRILARLAKRPESAYAPPVHLIIPPRRYPEVRSGRRLAFGPVEELPAVYCRGSFRSRCLADDPGGALRYSWLTALWFQNDLADPMADFVTTAVADLAWDEHAKDYEL